VLVGFVYNLRDEVGDLLMELMGRMIVEIDAEVGEYVVMGLMLGVFFPVECATVGEEFMDIVEESRLWMVIDFDVALIDGSQTKLVEFDHEEHVIVKVGVITIEEERLVGNGVLVKD
jgi:hypothetical protein